METWQIIVIIIVFSFIFIGLGFMGGYGVYTHIETKKLKKLREEVKKEEKYVRDYQATIEDLGIKNRQLKDEKCKLQIDELYDYLNRYFAYSKLIKKTTSHSPEAVQTILNILVTKKVDLHLLSWATSSVDAYNVGIEENWHKGHCKPLTEEEFKLICSYINELCWQNKVESSNQ